MTAPLITVLVTTYNYGQFVEQAINSILAQDFPPDKIQILVVDDGSTDDTSARVKKYGSRIEYLYKPNGGQASALNFGIARARGEIIALLDADDLFLPDKLSRIAQAFEQNPTVGMVYHRLKEWHTRTEERRDYKFIPVSGDLRKVPNDFLLYDPQPTSAISFRRISLNPLLPVPESISMLADCFLVSLIPFLSPILALPESLAVYRIHGKNSYSTTERQIPEETRKSRLHQWQIVFDAMRKWLTNHGYTEKQPPVRSFLNRWILRLQEEQFLIDPPGRLRFFSFLIQQNHAFRSLQTWRLTLFNYLYAPSALVLGYENADRFYGWRGTTMKAMERVTRAFLPARHNPGSSNTAEL
jgi:glycosyltransferase involved in cell wall biosynthesis